jgi:hypothetical protein
MELHANHVREVTNEGDNLVWPWLYAGVFVVLIAVTAGFSWLWQAEAERWIAEDGPVEMLSAAGYLACGALVWLWAGKKVVHQWDVQIILLAMALRELDFHSRFTVMNVTKLRFFTSASVPWVEKTIGLAVVAVLAAALVSFGRKHADSAWRGLRTCSAVVYGVGLGVFTAMGSKLIDGLPRKLQAVGVDTPEWLRRVSCNAEEIFELGIPLLFILAVLFLIRAERRADVEALEGRRTG